MFYYSFISNSLMEKNKNIKIQPKIDNKQHKTKFNLSAENGFYLNYPSIWIESLVPSCILNVTLPSLGFSASTIATAE